MPIIEYEKSCTLCGQQAVLRSFTLNTLEGELRFCCAGCLSIYELLNEFNATPLHNNHNKINEDT
jgi:hypothetical protein